MNTQAEKLADLNDNTYKGRSIFKDIKDPELRARNRACVLRNILAEYQLKPGTPLPPKCAKDVVAYFGKIPDAEKKDALASFNTVLREQGFYAEDV